MSPSVKAAIATIRSSADLIESAMADTEPAPFQVVLVRDRSSGRIHRRGRIEGVPGFLSYESDNADQAGVVDVIPDLASVTDEAELCDRCFGSLDIPGSEVPV